MKSHTAICKRYAITVVLPSLILVASCKQADTREQSQVPASKTSVTITSTTPKAAQSPPVKKQKAKPVVKVTKVAKKPVQVVKPKPKVIIAKAKPVPPIVLASKAPAPSARKPGTQRKQAVVKPNFGPNDPRSGIYLSVTGNMAGMGDPSKSVSDAYKIGQGAHPEALAGAGLPKDKFGLIDWMAIVNDGTIKPRDSLKAGVPEIPPFDMNVLIESKGDFVNDVLFPHKGHTYWLKCENCHTGIFIMAKGKNNITMQGIVQGKWCGRCHGKVAFPLTDCNRCHQTPKASTAAAKK